MIVGLISTCSRLRASDLAIATKLPWSRVLSFGVMTKALSNFFVGLFVYSAELFSYAFPDDCTAVAASFIGYFVDIFYDLVVFKEGNDCFCHALLCVKKD
jgi:hypothetical protein